MKLSPGKPKIALAVRAAKLFCTALIILLSACKSSTPIATVLKTDYYMVAVDDTKMFRQSKDTLLLYKVSPDYKTNFKQSPGHYKILNTEQRNSYAILKLEALDSIPLTTDPHPAKRYSVLIFKDINDKTAGQLWLPKGISKEQLDNIKVPDDLSNKFFGTLVTNEQLAALAKLKPVQTRKDAEAIIDPLKKNKYKTLIDQYEATKLNDMYGAAVRAELTYRASVDNGFNPIGASHKIDSLLKAF
ncbi:hypothetical protein GCM10023149_05890 [Mucilaginibacter gynuensis]|uniref:DUF4369 domain-containing protein n=1 Tax=Mucilaginibacter gynuensis TaxID=1302236 RepID=A0ABP8FU92_9SPHI